MKRIIETSGRDCYYQKDIFREAASAHLISDPANWIPFIEMLNLTIHTYDEENAEKVIAIFANFSKSLEELVINLIKLTNDTYR